MSGVFVTGTGAVSPAGWGVPPLWDCVLAAQPVQAESLPRPGWESPLMIRHTPELKPRPAFLSHPRLRRTSAISSYAVAAALEALGTEAGPSARPLERLGIILCVM